MNVAIIPARGGSKRIPNKNIKMFLGKPMIRYSIEAAIKSGFFDKVVVSTDSEKIAEVARKAGAEIPFIRPDNLSDDFTPLPPVFVHALKTLKEQGFAPKYMCGILPTAPFIRISDLKQGYDLVNQHKTSAVISVTTYNYPILRSLKINSSGYLEMLWPEYEFARSNDLQETFHDAGQFYWLDCDAFLANPKLFVPDALPVILPRHLVQDIDTPEDWEIAEIMYETCRSKGLL
jgi:pseudaminic acid cytidylyltransferase